MPGRWRVPRAGLLVITVPRGTVSDHRRTDRPYVRCARASASWASSTVRFASFGTSYRSLPSDRVSAIVPWSSTREPGAGSVPTTSPFGTLSEYAAGATVTSKPARSSLWVAAAWVIPSTPGVAV